MKDQKLRLSSKNSQGGGKPALPPPYRCSQSKNPTGTGQVMNSLELDQSKNQSSISKMLDTYNTYNRTNSSHKHSGGENGGDNGGNSLQNSHSKILSNLSRNYQEFKDENKDGGSDKRENENNDDEYSKYDK